MAKSYDVIVVGLGVMGSATTYEMASRGHRVLGLEQYGPDHEIGASRGESRLIRTLYFEHPLYVPLLKRAYELWYEVQERSGTSLIEEVGGLMLGPEDGLLLPGCRRSGTEHSLEFENLSAAEVASRFPAFRVSEDTSALLDPKAGFLHAGACVDAFRSLARAEDAELRFGEGVISWSGNGRRICIETETNTYEGSNVVLTPGGWMPQMLDEVQLPLTLTRQVLNFVRPERPELFTKDRFPVWVFEQKAGSIFYGTPAMNNAVKVAKHLDGEKEGKNIRRPEDLQNRTASAETEDVIESVEPILPSLGRNIVATRPCFYTSTPDQRFVIDRHPDMPQIVISSACSGHGFKFASVIGEIHADLVLNEGPAFDLAPFRLDRFA